MSTKIKDSNSPVHIAATRPIDYLTSDFVTTYGIPHLLALIYCQGYARKYWAPHYLDITRTSATSYRVQRKSFYQGPNSPDARPVCTIVFTNEG